MRSDIREQEKNCEMTDSFYRLYQSLYKETQSGQFVNITNIHILPTSKIAWKRIMVQDVSQTRNKPNLISRIFEIDFCIGFFF